MLKIGMIDADLIDNGTRHPNLAQMKMSSYCKSRNHDVKLLFGDALNSLADYDVLIVSKVFNYTKIPKQLQHLVEGKISMLNLSVEREIMALENGLKSGDTVIMLGGTGFYNDGGINLTDAIEHIMPDYNLYDEYIEEKVKQGKSRSYYKDYLNYSIGFTTRGCFRRCEFCVNKKYTKCQKHSPICEFLDESRPNIYLWDDNFFAFFNGWEEILDELIATKKPFQFRQGLDIRLMTEKHIQKLAKCKYHGDFIFAFDYIEDKEKIVPKIELWCKYVKKETKFYVLCAYDPRNKMDEINELRLRELQDIENTFERIRIIMSNHCLPYIMRYEDYMVSEYRGIYTQLARWCNQPRFFKKMTFREYCEANQNYSVSECASMKALNKLLSDAPHLECYVDDRW